MCTFNAINIKGMENVKQKNGNVFCSVAFKPSLEWSVLMFPSENVFLRYSFTYSLWFKKYFFSIQSEKM